MIKENRNTETPPREDGRLYLVERDGNLVKRTWADLTAAEREGHIKSERRAAYVADFNPCGLP